jgi:hypothetical protein
MSRVAVGLFALLLVGGGAAFFFGLLDPILGKTDSSPVPPPAKPTPPQAAVKPRAASAVAATPVAAPPQAATAQPVTTVTNKPTATQPAATTLAPAMTAIGTQPTDAANMEKPAVTVPPPTKRPSQPARSHDLDLRSCLDLTDNMAIAHCAYQAK